jgi:hypothetical protein
LRLVHKCNAQGEGHEHWSKNLAAEGNERNSIKIIFVKSVLNTIQRISFSAASILSRVHKTDLNFYQIYTKEEEEEEAW